MMSHCIMPLDPMTQPPTRCHTVVLTAHVLGFVGALNGDVAAHAQTALGSCNVKRNVNITLIKNVTYY